MQRAKWLQNWRFRVQKKTGKGGCAVSSESARGTCIFLRKKDLERGVRPQWRLTVRNPQSDFPKFIDGLRRDKDSVHLRNLTMGTVFVSSQSVYKIWGERVGKKQGNPILESDDICLPGAFAVAHFAFQISWGWGGGCSTRCPGSLAVRKPVGLGPAALGI